jgi:hypothetical protein
LSEVVLHDVRLPPGDTVWKFETDPVAAQPTHDNVPAEVFCLYNLKIELKAATPAGK